MYHVFVSIRVGRVGFFSVYILCYTLLLYSFVYCYILYTLLYNILFYKKIPTLPTLNSYNRWYHWFLAGSVCHFIPTLYRPYRPCTDPVSIKKAPMMDAFSFYYGSIVIEINFFPFDFRSMHLIPRDATAGAILRNRDFI